MSSKNKDIQDFFILIQKGIKKHGIKKIARTIRVIDLRKNNMFYHEIFSFIEQSVADEFNIKVKDLHEKDKRGNVTIARNIAIIVAKNHLDISDEELALEFNRTRQVVYRFRLDFIKMEREKKGDKLFLEKYDIINKKVVEYINKIKGTKDGQT